MRRNDPVRAISEIAMFGESTARSTQCQEKSPHSVRGVATICGAPDLRTVDAALFGYGGSNSSNLTVSHYLAMGGLMKPIG
jgi:hypothetical protein